MTTSRFKRFRSPSLLVLATASLSLVWACRERPIAPVGDRAIVLDGAAAGSTSTVEATLPNEPDTGCEPGANRCEGAALQACAEDGSGFVTSELCGNAALCQTARAGCSAASCIADEMICDGAELMICSAELTGFEAFATCESAAHCSSAERRCLTEPWT